MTILILLLCILTGFYTRYQTRSRTDSYGIRTEIGFETLLIIIFTILYIVFPFALIILFNTDSNSNNNNNNNTVSLASFSSFLSLDIDSLSKENGDYAAIVCLIFTILFQLFIFGISISTTAYPVHLYTKNDKKQQEELESKKSFIFIDSSVVNNNHHTKFNNQHYHNHNHHHNHHFDNVNNHTKNDRSRQKPSHKHTSNMNQSHQLLSPRSVTVTTSASGNPFVTSSSSNVNVNNNNNSSNNNNNNNKNVNAHGYRVRNESYGTIGDSSNQSSNISGTRPPSSMGFATEAKEATHPTHPKQAGQEILSPSSPAASGQELISAMDSTRSAGSTQRSTVGPLPTFGSHHGTNYNIRAENRWRGDVGGGESGMSPRAATLENMQIDITTFISKKEGFDLFMQHLVSEFAPGMFEFSKLSVNVNSDLLFHVLFLFFSYKFVLCG